MRRARIISIVVAVTIWAGLWAHTTWLEWVRPTEPDASQGFVRQIKGFQKVVYGTERDDAWRQLIFGTAMAANVAAFALAAMNRK